jgi:hypothetical protein
MTKRPYSIVNVDPAYSTAVMGTSGLSPLEYAFNDIKNEIDNLTDEEKLEMFKMLNDEYKVLLRKEKLNKLI